MTFTHWIGLLSFVVVLFSTYWRLREDRKSTAFLTGLLVLVTAAYLVLGAVPSAGVPFRFDGLFLLLTATLVAAVLVRWLVFRWQLRGIESVAKKDRLAMAQTILNGVNVDTTNLTRQQRFELAQKVLRGRAFRYFGALVLIAVVGLGGVGLYAAMSWSGEMDLPLSAVGLHHLRVTVVDVQGDPVEAEDLDATVGGDLKKTASGWELDLPEAGLPDDRRVTLWAEADGWRGSETVTIPRGRQTSGQLPVTIRLPAPPDEVARGLVTDPQGRALRGATVRVVGGLEEVITDAGGTFVLRTGLPPGDEVRLRVVHPSYGAEEVYHLLGGQPARVVMGK